MLLVDIFLTERTNKVLHVLRYLLSGDGNWLSRWDATGHDALVASVSIIFALALVILSLVYALQTREAVRFLQKKEYVKHHQSLIAVFVWGSVVHFLVSVVSWIFPAYFLADIAMVVASLYYVRLIITKQHLLAVQAQWQGEQAKAAMSEVAHALDSEEIHTITHRLEKITEIVRTMR